MNNQMIEAYIDGIIHREGRQYTNHPADKGGPTKFGITQKTLSGWRGKPVTAKDVEQMEEGEAREIYKAEYITKPRFNLINNGELAGLLIDWGVTSGANDAVKGLQRVLNTLGAQLKVDGVLGPKTAAAANEISPQTMLRNRVVGERIRFHCDDTQKRPSQIVFLEGWINRCLQFFAY